MLPHDLNRYPGITEEEERSAIESFNCSDTEEIKRLGTDRETIDIIGSSPGTCAFIHYHLQYLHYPKLQFQLSFLLHRNRSVLVRKWRALVLNRTWLVSFGYSRSALVPFRTRGNPFLTSLVLGMGVHQLDQLNQTIFVLE